MLFIFFGVLKSILKVLINIFLVRIKNYRYLKIFLNMSFFYELILLEIMFRIQRMHKTVPFILAFLFILNMMIIKYEDNNNKNLVRFVCILIILRIF